MPAKSQRHTKFIYALADPRDHLIRYIGQTNNMAERFRCHTQYGSARQREAHTPKGRWCLRLIAEGTAPVMILLATVPWAEADDAERQWIAFGAKLGWPLFNVMVNPRQLHLLADERLKGNGCGSD
jgi:hypothetical protein